MTLESLVGTKRILVVMGPGGVGKTTLAATLGLEAARRGRRALVLTIDPAMRLADALGLGSFSAGDHHMLPEETLSRSGVPAKRPLRVAMLDTARLLGIASLNRRACPTSTARGLGAKNTMPMASAPSSTGSEPSARATTSRP